MVFIAYFRRKEKDIIKLGKEFLIWGLGLTFFGTILTILTYSSLESSLESPHELAYSSLVYYIAIIMMYLFGVSYFILGVSKLKNLFKEISNIVLIYFGVISYILFIPLFLYGYLSPIKCTSYRCRWHSSLIQIGTLYLGIFMLISSIITFFLELLKIKGEIFENFISKQVEENTIEPLSKKLYKIRIEENYKVCGYCEEKNRFETLNEKVGLFRCLKCDSENYL